MKRREFLASASAAAAALVLAPRISFAADGTVEVIVGSDQNIADFWSNVVVPALKTSMPDVDVNVTVANGNSGMMALADRALAAMKTKSDPQIDLMEAFNPRNTVGGIEAGLWVDFADANMDNYAKLSSLAIDTDFGLPYRGSQVVLAYDADRVETPPTTWEELTAFIKGNEGQFIYNRPDKGGAGGNFVRRAIHEANGRDPSLFTADNYTKEKGETMLTPAWDILKDLGPSMYQNGSYTAGNTASLQLLVSGVVSMVPAWSDQALTGMRSGELPPNIKLTQLKDLAFVGGYAFCTIPSNSVHRDTALKLADVLISPEVQEQIVLQIAGFPAIEWSYLSEETRTANADIIPSSIPAFPDGEWEAAVNDGWYRNVAPGISRD
ncbi:extracellular solute-binding protein [Martelella sp. HB161492]|uniref:extracellular solute-binding protein n=1 Tax=Martelella sp. HB161492 TaxID=2720726 RepID=UPI00159013F2|nr:extracellular solute-binding protein [Martelella sp. HB161492]